MKLGATRAEKVCQKTKNLRACNSKSAFFSSCRRDWDYSQNESSLTDAVLARGIRKSGFFSSSAAFVR
jgi:hypothetical protein